jgi:hypothetical protein
MMIKKGGFLILLFVSAAGGFGQNYQLVGTVVDSATKEKLFYAAVGLLHAKDSTASVSTTSDEEGKFVLDNVPKGSYILKTSYIGYHPCTQPITVEGTEKKIHLAEIAVSPLGITLEGFTVTEKKPVYMADGEKTLYHVSQDPAVQTGTVSDALQNAPGVEVDIEGNITLRGVSSVEIWINDKPSRLNAENLKTYIQQMPANSIERIEVITHPSAKYSAKGTGGIINIVTSTGVKKNSFISFGINGSTMPYIAPYVSLGYQNRKLSVNLYLNGSFSIWKSDYTSSGYVYDDQGNLSSHQRDTVGSRSKNYSGGSYVNFSYQVDTNNEISFWGGAWPRYQQSENKNSHHRQEYLYHPDAYHYDVSAQSASSPTFAYFGLGYEHSFRQEGHKLSMHASGNLWGFGQNRAEERRIYDSSHAALNKHRKTITRQGDFHISPSVSYTVPYLKEKGEISAGVSGNYTSDRSLHHLDTSKEGTIYLRDSLRSYDALYDGYSLESYFTIQHKFGGFTVKAGLRAEYEYTRGRFFDATDRTAVGNWGLFPSLHLSYRTKSMHNFSLSYSRRVNFPSAESLVSHIFYDEESFRTGNPDLKPAFTHSAETGWMKFFDKFGSLSLNAYIRYTKGEENRISDVVYSDVFGRIVSFSQPFHSGVSCTAGGSANVTYRLKAFMNIRFDGGIRYGYSETVFRKNQQVITRNLTYNVSINFWAKLWKRLEIHASTRYSSRSKTVFAETEPGFSVNGGLRADFLKRKISVYLNVNDIFNTNKQINRNTNPYYVTHSTRKYTSRTVSGGITFRFGKMELESMSGGVPGGGQNTP